MSQVIVTRDSLHEKRERSRIQELNIDRDGFLKPWIKPTDATKASPLEVLIGLALLPLLGFWGLILFLLSLCLSAFVALLRGCGILLSILRK